MKEKKVSVREHLRRTNGIWGKVCKHFRSYPKR